MIGADHRTCEFAISVTDEWTGAGLGRVLMEILIGAARGRGLREMEGFVLAENRGMLALARKLGFTVGRHPDDYTLCLCRRRLDAPDEA